MCARVRPHSRTRIRHRIRICIRIQQDHLVDDDTERARGQGGVEPGSPATRGTAVHDNHRPLCTSRSLRTQRQRFDRRTIGSQDVVTRAGRVTFERRHEDGHARAHEALAWMCAAAAPASSMA